MATQPGQIDLMKLSPEQLVNLRDSTEQVC